MIAVAVELNVLVEQPKLMLLVKASAHTLYVFACPCRQISICSSLAGNQCKFGTPGSEMSK